MTKEKIIEIFKVILKRDPNNKEIERYIIKNKFSNFQLEDLIKELSNCEEKFKHLRSVSGDHIKNKTNYSEEDVDMFFSSKKYKVAICLSGHLREYKKNLASINRYIVKPLNADVFIHTWSEDGKQIVATKGMTGPVPNTTHMEIPELSQYIQNVKSLEIGNNKEYLETIKELEEKKFYLYGMSLKNGYYGGQAEPKYIYSQFHSINKAFENLTRYSKDNGVNYDIVIKMRADYCLYSGITEKELDSVMENKKTIRIPTTPYSSHGHPSCCLCAAGIEHEEHCEDVCDVFAFSSYINMKHYHDIYYSLEDLRVKQNSKNEGLRNDEKFILENKGEFILNDIWKPNNYKIDCFYPERLFREYLKDYRLLPSRLSGEVLR